ncbi:MAG TPA: autotransporter-associated beta strand repeat-containing protein [Fimbriiglobus sp.]|nr:autotransporter-associated beta strand repeat-containing protein [Fimbriiglobus sp.]
MRTWLLSSLWAAVGLALLAGPVSAQSPTHTWGSATSGNWSLGSNWIGGVAPAAGGGAATVLQFNNPFIGSLSSNNDLGNPFDLNGMIINLSPSSFFGSSTSVFGTPLRFVANGGTGPVLNVSGYGGAYVGPDVQLAATLATNVGANGTLTFGAAISGAGGLTLNGPGLVSLTGTNSYTGATAINAGVLNIGSGAALGATSGVTIAGGTATGPAVGLESYLGAAVNVSQGITITGAGLYATLSGGSSFSNGSLTVTGAVGGAGGVLIRNNVTLSGANTYQGPTRVGTGSSFDGTHVLTISSDTNLGAGGALELASGTVRLAGDWTSARAVNVIGSGTMDTNGHAATWSGAVTGTTGGFGSTGLIKTGAGTLTLTAAGSLALPVTVAAGELRLAGNGALASTSFTLGTGARLTLDNTGTNVGIRLADFAGVVLNEGEFLFQGGSAAAATETFGYLSSGQSVSGGIATVTIAPGAGQSAALTASGLTLFDAVLVRGQGLGTAGSSQLFFTTAPFLTGSGAAGTPEVGVIAGLIGDTSATGTGSTVLTYDATLGVRPLAANEYAGTVTSGATTPANVRLTGAVAGINAPTAINTLTLAAGGSVAGTGRLNVNANTVLATGAGAAVNVGALAFGDGFGSTADLVLLGATSGADLTISSPIEITGYSPRLTKFGDGLVTLNGAVTGTTFDGQPAPVTAVSVAGGTLRLGAAANFPAATLAVGSGATLDLNGNSKTFAGLSGAGTVQLGAGTLTLSPTDVTAPGGYVFGGAVTGSGGLTVGVGLNLSAANSYTGPTAVTETGSLTLTGDGRLATSALTVHGLLTLDNLSGANRSDRIGAAAPLQLTGGQLTLHGNRSANTSQSVGPLTLGPGGNVIGVEAQGGWTTTLTFASLTREPTATLNLNLNRFDVNSTPRVAVTTAPTLVGGILPYATANGINFVTYDAGTGLLRPLQFNEYTALAPGTSTAANATVNAAVTMNAATQVNSLSLVVGSGGGGTSLSGTGTLTVSSGAILAETAATLGVPVAFGGAEGIVHAYSPLIVSGPISGSGGLTITGTSDVTLSGASTYTGQTTLNGGRVVVNGDIRNGQAGPLGAGSSPVVFNGTSLTPSFGFIPQPELVLGSGVTRFERPLVVSAGADPRVMTGRLTGSNTPAGTLFTGGVTLNRGLVVAAPPEGGAGTGFTFDGVISGAGGLELARGLTTLNGANTYSGGTVLGDSLFGSSTVVVAVGHDTALGTGPVTVRSFETTLRAVGGARTLANPFAFTSGSLTIDGSNGLTLTGPMHVGNGISLTVTNTGPTVFAGPVSNLPDSFGQLNKAGAGTLTLTAANPLTLGVAVNGGTLRLSGGGTLTGVSSLSVADGATLLLDNTAAGGNVSGRLNAAAFVNLHGGEVRLLGSSTAATSEAIGSLSASAAPTLTVVPGAGREAVLNVSSTGGSPMLIRGTNLGSAGTADVGRVVIESPFLVGGFGSAGTPAVGVLSGVVGDTSATGLGSTVVTHDAAVGVRPLTAGEYASSITPGATSPENVRLTTAAAVGIDTRITSLTLGAGGSVTGVGPLRIASGVVVADGGSPTVSVGSLVSEPGSFSFAATPGVTLTVDSQLGGGFGFGNLAKFGAGTVILNGAPDPVSSFSRLDVTGGTLQLGAAPTFPTATASIKSGATLDLAGNSKSFTTIEGNGTVRLGSGTLTLTGGGFFFGNTFGGVIEGAGGGLTVTGSTLDLTGVSTYTGPTTVARNASITLRNGGALAGTSALNVSGTVNLDSTRRANSLGTAAVTLTGGTLVVDGGAENFGTLTVGAGSNTLQLNPPAAVTAAGLARSDRGTLRVTGEFGQPAFGSGSSLVLTTPPTLAGNGPVGTPSVGVVPHIATQTIFPPPFLGGISTTGSSLVTYEAGVGLRPLTASEYAPLVSGQTTQNNALVTSPTTVASNTTVQSLTLVSSISPVSVGGTGTLTVSQGAVVSTGTASVSAPLAFGGAEAVFHVGESSFGIPGSATLTVSGGLTGSNGLTLAGPGTLVLGGTANPGGPVAVNAGTLRADGTLTAAGTGLTVRRGATLMGVGTVAGAATLEEGSVLAPGASIGTLTVNGDVVLLGSFKPEVSAFPAASDRLVVNGNLTLGASSVLDLTSFNTFNPTTTYTLISVTPGGLTGTFGSVSGFVPGDFNLVYTNHSVELVPVPEPGGILLACGAASGLIALWRRSRAARTAGAGTDGPAIG